MEKEDLKVSLSLFALDKPSAQSLFAGQMYVHRNSLADQAVGEAPHSREQKDLNGEQGF